MNPIVLCAALPQEVKPLCRRLGIIVPSAKRSIVEGISLDGCSVRVAVSGMGHNRMARLIQSMSHGPVLCWVSLGYAGGLSPDLAVGDCIVGHSVVSEEGVVSSLNSPSQGESCLSDSLYCSAEAVCTPEEKYNLYRRTGAVAVDMESLAIVRVAQARGEPFTWIRVISDAAHETIPPALAQCIGSNGFPDLSAGVKTVFLNPSLLPFMIRMGIRSGTCATRLAEAVLPWMLLYHSPTAQSISADD